MLNVTIGRGKGRSREGGVPEGLSEEVRPKGWQGTLARGRGNGVCKGPEAGASRTVEAGGLWLKPSEEGGDEVGVTSKKRTDVQAVWPLQCTWHVL